MPEQPASEHTTWTDGGRLYDADDYRRGGSPVIDYSAPATAAPSIFPSIYIDLNVRCSDHGSTTYVGLEDVYGGPVAPATVVLCIEPEGRVQGLGVVKHIDHERRLVYVNIDFRSLHEPA